MKNFEEMVELTRAASTPASTKERLEATLANLPERQPAQTSGTHEAQPARRASGGARIIRPRWRRNGLAVAGVAACAALTLCLAGGPLGLGTDAGAGDETPAPSARAAIAGNMFTVQQAYGVELAPGQASDGSILAMTSLETGQIGEDGCFPGLGFKIEGENIAKVNVSISKGELCRVTHTEMSRADFDAKWPKGRIDDAEGRVHMTYWDDEDGPIYDDFCEAVGPQVEEAYDPDIAYGFYQPASMVDALMANADDDVKGPFWSLVDSFDGAQLKVSVTYEDGTTEAKSYNLAAGKLKVKFAEEGEGFELLQEFTDGENDPFVYGLLATQSA